MVALSKAQNSPPASTGGPDQPDYTGGSTCPAVSVPTAAHKAGVQHPWARHYQTIWLERAGDARLPHWLRVAALAYGSHAANGHAPFAPGQIGIVLGDPGLPLHRGNVQRAIRVAVKYGWLSPNSGSRCLVVPAHAIEGGVGSRFHACHHHRKVVTQ